MGGSWYADNMGKSSEMRKGPAWKLMVLLESYNSTAATYLNVLSLLGCNHEHPFGQRMPVVLAEECCKRAVSMPVSLQEGEGPLGTIALAHRS